MPDIQKILYPLELSHISHKVAPWAAKMAIKWGAELHVLHVVPGLGFHGLSYAAEALIAKDLPLLIKKAKPLVRKFCAAEFKGVASVKQAVVTGDPAAEIVKYAREKGIDVIVMGTHSQAGLERAIFGSVADKVTRTSSVPVLVVPPHHT
jgi:nucleotide-binding universal stress UspA family protein